MECFIPNVKILEEFKLEIQNKKALPIFERALKNIFVIL